MELTEMQISLLDDGDPYAPPDSNPGRTEPRQLSAATHVFAPRPGHRLMIRAGLRQAPEAVTYFNRFVLEHDEVRARPCTCRAHAHAHAAHMRMPRTCACACTCRGRASCCTRILHRTPARRGAQEEADPLLHPEPQPRPLTPTPTLPLPLTRCSRSRPSFVRSARHTMRRRSSP